MLAGEEISYLLFGHLGACHIEVSYLVEQPKTRKLQHLLTSCNKLDTTN